MARTTQRGKKDTSSKIKIHHKGNEGLTYRGYKRMAVSMGMPFPDACAADYNELASYIYNNRGKKENRDLIVDYDKWMDKQLELAGYAEDDPMRHYQLGLAYIAEDAMTNLPKMGKKPKKAKEVKPKREKDEKGLWKGTKKSYTFELTSKGYSLERITRRVLKKFPDANENSIKQWYKKALKNG